VHSSGRTKPSEYAVGDVIDGRFEVLQLLGRGGFSKVYRVRDDVEDEERAFKLFDNVTGYEASRREIGALRKIQHPNVVKVFWAGKTNAGDWYLITEFIDGESLDEFATGKRSLRDREAVDVAVDLLDALVAFHPDAARIKQLEAQRRDGDLTEAESRELTELRDKGLVHRDIKPLNVILTRTGAKLLDFNIASRVGDPVHTQSGTPPYQPPDAGLDRWDVSTDLFAVGVLLYRLLCNGHHPFPHAMPMAGVPVTNPTTIRPDLDHALAGFLVKACAPASADRFATAADMRLALRDIRAGLLPAFAAGLLVGDVRAVVRRVPRPGKRHRYPRLRAHLLPERVDVHGRPVLDQPAIVEPEDVDELELDPVPGRRQVPELTEMRSRAGPSPG
jgi:serine/threonine protein kinase